MEHLNLMSRTGWQRAALALLAPVALVGPVCTVVGPASATSVASTKAFLNKSYAGSTITVLLPSWGQMPAKQLAKFTAATGIKVNLQTLAFDSIHDKVVTSEAAGIAPADVTEMDWSWVGQFGAAGWYTPLSGLVASSAESQMSPSFVYNHQQIAVPYNMDFRGLAINMTDFEKAGITSVPTTWAQVLADAQLLKAKQVVKYPVSLPLEVSECNSTVWYGLIKSGGGELLNNQGQPTFTSLSSVGGQALVFEQELYQDGLVPPGAISIACNDTTFASGQTAIVLSASPASMPYWKDPAQSKVAKQDIVFAPLPGTGGVRTGTFGLPEGMGIPKLSSHKAQAAMFIDWWQQVDQQLVVYKALGDFPPQIAALKELGREGKLYGASAILRILPTVKPLFANGTPTWYPQFSNDVASMLLSVVEGKIKPNAALSRLVQQTKSLASQG